MTIAFYTIKVQHRRLVRPLHQLSYRTAYLGFDIEHIHEVNRALAKTPYSVRADDYGFKDWSSLAAAIRHRAIQEVPDATGPVRLITLPRLFGRGFNPISLFLVHGPNNGQPKAIIYDVRNTFGDRHHYTAPLGDGRHERAKKFHVSPFLDCDGHYRFNFDLSGTQLHLGITKMGQGGAELYARLDGHAQPATTGRLWRSALSLPTQGIGILAAIHWEALKLWVKGAPYFPYKRDNETPMITESLSQ